MFEYRYEIVHTSGFLSFRYKKDVSKLIEENARQGWRFVQLICTSWDGHGKVKEGTLIFERPKNWEEENAMYELSK